MSIMSTSRRRVWTVFSLALVLGASAAQATTVLRVTFSQVVDGADIIAVGTVSAVTETWDAEQETPFTHVTFSDLEVLKGEIDAGELTLRFLGGPAPDGLTLVVAGMPRFEVRQRAVVFSTGNGLVACPLVGWWQGLYRVVYDAERRDFTVADHAGRDVVAVDGAVGRRVTRMRMPPEARGPRGAADAAGFRPGAADALTLDEFKALVREEL